MCAKYNLFSISYKRTKPVQPHFKFQCAKLQKSPDVITFMSEEQHAPYSISLTKAGGILHDLSWNIYLCDLHSEWVGCFRGTDKPNASKTSHRSVIVLTLSWILHRNSVKLYKQMPYALTYWALALIWLKQVWIWMLSTSTW